MKALILLIIVSSVVEARSIVPGKVVTPNLDLFSRRNKVLRNGDVEVRVSTFNKHGTELIRDGGKKVITKEAFDQYVALSKTVYQTIPKQEDGVEGMKGTAFNIGNNLVITNNHVLDPSFRNTSYCDGFQIRGTDEETYECRKVHFCSPEHDVCLIEMATKIKKKCLFRCAGVDVSLSTRPALKLKNNYTIPYHQALEETYTAIGNSAGYGIHFSQGQGAIFTSDYVRFWAPIISGNSGGPLLNSENLVVGVVKHQSANFVSNDMNQTFNGAAPAALTIKLIRDGLRDNPETLLKFNQSVIE